MFKPSSWLVFGWLVLTAAEAMAAERPLTVRNNAPVSQLYGVPVMRGGDRCCADTSLSFRAAQVSNFTSADAGADQVFFDGETTIAEYTVSRPLGARAEWGLNVPVLLHSGGVLDGFLDGFHDLFGLPDGGRDLARRDQLDYFVRVDGTTYVRIRENRTGVGDVSAWLGYQLLASPARALMLRGQLKLPSGRVSRLTGSEALDLALWAELTERALLSRLGIVVTLGAGGVFLGEGELAPRTQESWAAVAHLGLQRAMGEHFTLIGQLDAHSRLLDTRAAAIGGAALIGGLGVRANVTPRFSFSLGLLEDLKSRSTADVVFQLQLDVQL